MISRMKKLTMIMYHAEKEKILNSLQELGIVHLEFKEVKMSDKIIKKQEELAKQLEMLHKIEELYNKRLSKNEPSQGVKIDINNEYETLSAQLRNKYDQLNHVSKDIERLIPFGAFDPITLKKLLAEGLVCAFLKIPKKAYRKNIANKSENVFFINSIKDSVYALYLSKTTISNELKTYEEIIPFVSLTDAEEKQKAIELNIESIEKNIGALHFVTNEITDKIATLQNEISFCVVDNNLSPEHGDKLFLGEGYLPGKKVKKLQEKLGSLKIVYYVNNPKPTDSVPIELNNGMFSKLFERITKVHSLPIYSEVDPTPFFAPFFALFFGMCFGDIGYGFILAVIAFIFLLQKKFRKFNDVFKLGLVLGFSAFFCGILLDSFFGASNLSLLIDKNILPSSFKSFIVLGSINDAMAFSILLGVLQLTLGYILAALNSYQVFGFKGLLQPIGTLFLMLATLALYVPSTLMIGPFAIGQWVYMIPQRENVSYAMLAFGMISLICFNNLDKKFYWRPLLFLWVFYNTATGIFTNLLSYVRIFALGLSGGLLGKAFNDIALMIKGDDPGFVAIIGMILVLVLGHTLNFSLAIIGSLVHPLRLQFLEFYSTMGFSGGGKQYRPLKLIKNSLEEEKNV